MVRAMRKTHNSVIKGPKRTNPRYVARTPQLTSVTEEKITRQTNKVSRMDHFSLKRCIQRE